MRPSLLLFLTAFAISGCSAAATNAPAVPQANGIARSVADPSGKKFAIDGKLYIAGMQYSSSPAGLVQAYTGVAPRLLGTIQGAASQLSYTIGVATDKHGDIFVSEGSDSGRSCDGCSIVEFSKDRYGDVNPIATIPTIGAMEAVVFDAHDNLYGAGLVTGSGKGAGVVYRYDRGTYIQSRRLDPTHYSFGIALAGDGTIYMSSSRQHKQGESVEVFAAGTQGSSRPVGVIAGSKTQMLGPTGIAIDGAGNIFVGQSFSNTITVYPAGTKDGDVAPMRTIVGPDTQLNGVSHLAFDKNGNLFVETNSQVLVFVPGAEGDAAPVAAYAKPAQNYDIWGMTIYPQLPPG
jgi:serine/threonine protein kinase, bacterial